MWIVIRKIVGWRKRKQKCLCKRRSSDVENKFLTTEITETDLNHEYLATLYYNFTPNVAEGTLKVINDIGSSQSFFKIPAPIQAQNIWSILLLVIGVFIGIFITICIYSVCSGQWCKRKGNSLKIRLHKEWNFGLRLKCKQDSPGIQQMVHLLLILLSASKHKNQVLFSR